MDKKRRFCDHCNDFVNQRTYRLHYSLYYDENSGIWEKTRTYSSEDDSNTDEERTREDAGFPDTYEPQPSDSPTENVQGVLVDELEEEDVRLTEFLTGVCEEELMYMEQPLFEASQEVWNLNEDEINHDFTPTSNGQSPMYHDVREDNAMHIIQWMMIFLCMWSSYCYVSDHAMEILISFIGAVFKALGSLFPAFAGMALLFPNSLNALKCKLGMNKDEFLKFVVCPKCETLYDFDECYEERFGRTVIKKCQFINNENHRQAFRRTVCNEPLLKEVILKNGKKRFYPFKVFCYNSIIDSLKRMVARQNFLSNCEQWRTRNVPQGILTDIFDGKVWKDFLYIQGQPFLANPHNFAFMMNVDWFQPFKHSLYSVGAIYMVFMNLPRELRFKPENIILVGVIPGPHEPKLTINTYLKPLVAELNTLWKGLEIHSSEAGGILTIHAALLCVGCDVPAARKVCGFTGHGSCQGCSKCKKVFTGNVSERMDFSGFEPCPPRTNEEHRKQAQDILNQTSATDKSSKEKEYGTRFTELMMLPYFDCVRFHIIDPMHNLFTGTAKHIMKNIWLDDSLPLIERKKLEQIQKKIDKIIVPSSVGRLPKKICNSYGGFTADQWKAWTIIYSIYALWNVLPQKDLEVWRNFVLACSILCTPIITETKARLGHLHLMSFCKEFEKLYGSTKVTPNMHLHTHILQCIFDYGPVYSFWLFSFERYNGILGEYSTNQRSIEIQIMRKFLSEQFVKAISLPTSYKDIFAPLLSKLRSSTIGTVNSAVYDSSSDLVIKQSLLSIGPVRKGLFWIIPDQVDFMTCIPPIFKTSIAMDSLPYLKSSYKSFLSGVDESSVTASCEVISSIRVAGEIFGSLSSRHCRSAYILAAWCGLNGRVDSSGTNLRPGVIQHFLQQNVHVNGQLETCILAEVKWFQEHHKRHKLGAPVQVWCKDHYEIDGPAGFLPLQRIHSKFVPAYDTIDNENVLVVCPLPRKLQC